MTREILAAVVVGVSLAGNARAEDVNARLLWVLAQVESNCNDAAVGDSGKARGRYQIWPCYVDDVNRIAGTSFTHNDAHDPSKARQMVLIYLTHYGEIYRRRTSQRPSVEVFCRIHNGGPAGWRKEVTRSYWNRCKEAMKNHEKQEK